MSDWQVIHGDCLEVLPTLEAASVDTVITDPPYGYEFMGKGWDHGVPGQRFWREIARVAKPGAMLFAFGGTRTHHRLMSAIEDAGWEIRDCMMWLYGQGFPKSYDISKGMDKAAGVDKRPIVGEKRGADRLRNQAPDGKRNGRGKWGDEVGRDPYLRGAVTPEAETWDGWGTALKPAWEPIIVAMNPRDGTFVNNALKWGVSGIWIDGARISTNDNLNGGAYAENSTPRDNWYSKTREGDENVFRRGGAGKYKQPQGRWPANLLLSHNPRCDGDCHPDCAVRILGDQSGESTSTGGSGPASCGGMGKRVYGDYALDRTGQNAGGLGDTGTAARFFYTPKASKSERTCDGKVDNDHPTVKPLEIVQYLVRLSKTPTGGVVLDPFMGSGTTGIACRHEGREFIGIEQNEHYCDIARQRIEEAQAQPVLL